MAKASLRQQFREDPRGMVIAVGVTGVVYVAVGLVRPRWLTLASRRTWRGWLRQIPIRLLFIAAVEVWLKPFQKRYARAQEELKEELGRDPTPEELMARVEALKART